MRSVFDSFQKGKEQAPQWKQQYDESQTITKAFEDDFVQLNPKAYIRTDEMDRLGILLGQIINTPYSTTGVHSITLVGPSRSGKTSAAKITTADLNEQLEENYAQYVQYDEHFWDWWDKTDFHPTQIIFLDGILPVWDDLDNRDSYEYLVNKSKYDKVLVITILSTIEYQWLRERKKLLKPTLFDQVPFEFKFRRPQRSEIEEIITQRFELLGNISTLSDNVPSSISILSLGLPGLALWITRHLPLSNQNKNPNNRINIDDLNNTIIKLNFEPALKIAIENNMKITQEEKTSSYKEIWPIVEPLSSISSSLGQSLKQFKKITSSRLPILKEMLIMDKLHGEIKRSDLQERTGIKESSLTYQCQNLVKENFVSYLKDGREVLYQLTSPIKEALELLFFD